MNKLKCKNCKAEWSTPQNKQYIVCPFCHAPLIVVQEEFEDLDAALSYLVSNFGSDILRSKQNTLQFLEEFFQAGKREYILLNNLYVSGLIETLFRLQNLPSIIQNNTAVQVGKQLTEKYGVSKEWAEYIVGCVCKALGLSNNVDESIISLRQSAERGIPSSQVKLAKHYLTGQGVKIDKQKYIFWLGKAAENGYTEAQYLLGLELYNGRTCERSIESAIIYLDRAARSNNVDAMCLILSKTELQTLSSLQSEEIARFLVERQNDLSSDQLNQLSGYFEELDLSKALDMARLSYEKDAKNAWQNYVSLLRKLGTHESEAKALKVTKEIALGGNAIACLCVGRRCENQAKTENDMKTALYWYRMAAENGNLDAQIRLGEIYEVGKLVKKDVECATYWYKAAAYNGSSYAKTKVDYKSSECILKTLNLIFEDDIERECQVLSVVSFQGNDYVIVEDPDTKECFPLKYMTTDTMDGFEIEQVDERTEEMILGQFSGSVSK